MTSSPFRALGLNADPGLTDDDIRAAWHRIAAATHPDRADGGDPAAFRAAAAAYSELRTRYGRGEALADLRGRPAGRAPGRVTATAGNWAARVRGGRPGRLALLILGAVAVSFLAVLTDGWRPASLALIVGSATWVLRGGRRYLGARDAGPAEGRPGHARARAGKDRAVAACSGEPRRRGAGAAAARPERTRRPERNR
jgi:curved DNA-binding protein CbpA